MAGEKSGKERGKHAKPRKGGTGGGYRPELGVLQRKLRGDSKGMDGEEDLG